jgi:hypothetical protein
MLKTVSSITNAIGALNFKGTWNASTNTPTLASGVGTKGDYFVVGVAGTTTLDGISTWGVGDWATYNGSVWQRVEGGADLEGVNLSVSGTTNLAALTASTALALDASKNVVSVTNTGTGNNVLGTSPTMATPTLTGDVQMSTGNLVVGTSGKGIDFSATGQAAGMTSELFADYEEGTWTPSLTGPASQTFTSSGYYVKVGRTVVIQGIITWTVAPSGGGNYRVFMPFGSTTNKGSNINFVTIGLNNASATAKYLSVIDNTSEAFFRDTNGSALNFGGLFGTGSVSFSGVYTTT